jgi:hypothetical protein
MASMREGPSNTPPPITVEDTATGAGPLPSPEVEGLHGEFWQEEKRGERDGRVELGYCGYWFLSYRVGVALALPGRCPAEATLCCAGIT